MDKLYRKNTPRDLNFSLCYEVKWVIRDRDNEVLLYFLLFWVIVFYIGGALQYKWSIFFLYKYSATLAVSTKWKHAWNKVYTSWCIHCTQGNGNRVDTGETGCMQTLGGYREETGFILFLLGWKQAKLRNFFSHLFTLCWWAILL